MNLCRLLRKKIIPKINSYPRWCSLLLSCFYVLSHVPNSIVWDDQECGNFNRIGQWCHGIFSLSSPIFLIHNKRGKVKKKYFVKITLIVINCSTLSMVILLLIQQRKSGCNIFHNLTSIEIEYQWQSVRCKTF